MRFLYQTLCKLSAWCSREPPRLRVARHFCSYAIASALAFVYAAAVLLPHLSQSSVYCGCLPSSDAVDGVLRWYFLSKLVEATDLVLVTLRGFPVSRHFQVHHYTTPLFAYVGWQSRSAHGATFCLLNLFMHAMVYTFHAGYQPALLLRALRLWQHVQLLGGTVLAVGACWQRAQGTPCTTDDAMGWLADALPPALYLTYYVLFQQELAEERVEHQKHQKRASD